MKRILFIIPHLRGGGAEKVLVDILKYIDYSRFQVDLLLEYNEGIYLDDLPNTVGLFHLFDKYGLGMKILQKSMKVLKLFDFYWRWIHVPRLKKRLPPRHWDTIVSFMEGTSLKCHSFIIDRGNKHITWVHIDLFANHYTSSYFKNIDKERNAYEQMDRIIFVSADAMNAFEKNIAVCKKNSVIYNPIDKEKILAESLNCPISKSKFTICAVGRLTKQKCFDRLIRVAYFFKKAGYDLDFWILGAGELEGKLKRLCKELKVEDMVSFLGFVKPPYSYVREADILLSTSYAEGFPLVLCEALCIGKPIVSTKVAGPIELLENSNYGILTEEDDSAIFEGLKSLIDNPELLLHYQKKALERSSMFDIDKTMQEIYTVLN